MSLDGEGNGDFYFLAACCLFLLLLKERACITFKIRMKLLPWGGETYYLLLFHAFIQKIDFLPSVCMIHTHIHTYKYLLNQIR